MKTYIGNGGGGFTMIEIVVVLVIIGILAGLMVTQFTGSKIKANVENGVRQVFSDLTEMRVKAMSDNTNYSITWTFDSNNDFQSYTKSSGIAAALLNKMSALNNITGVTFNEKGLSTSKNELQLYAKCPECDQNCDSDTGKDRTGAACTPLPADQPPSGLSALTDCTNISYPEYSCISITETRIKMGKWCDTNKNGVYNDGECAKK